MSIDNQSQVKSLDNFGKSEMLISAIQLRDDRAFIRECLSMVTGNEYLALVNEYLEQWRKAAEAEPVEHKKENASRFAANTWLRIRSEK